jgi:predicted nuclease of predicted toxin-antitoxin system
LLFLLDENLPDDLGALIRAQGHRAFTVSAGGRRALDDRGVWDWAAAESAILVTRDLDFPLPGRRPAPYAVVLLRGKRLIRGELLALWAAAFERFDFTTLEGRVVSIHRGRRRSRALP